MIARWTLRILGSLLFALGAAPESHAGDLIGYAEDFGDVLPAELVRVDAATGARSALLPGCPDPLAELGFVVALTRAGQRVYGLEQGDGLDPDARLWRLDLPETGCAVATHVGGAEVGFPGLESLAWVPELGEAGSLFSASFDRFAGVGELVRIDPETGLGEGSGQPLPTNLRGVGMTWDADAGALWALGSGFGVSDARVPELVALDPSTGDALVIGPTGLARGEAESLALEFTASGPALRAAGAGLWEIDTQTGAAFLIAGPGDPAEPTLWGLSDALDPLCDERGGDRDGDRTCDDVDVCPDHPARDQSDSDGNGVGDACECGDASGDGVVNSIDARLIQRCAVGFFDCPRLCDVTGEGTCNSVDARLVQRFAVGALEGDALSCPRRP